MHIYTYNKKYRFCHQGELDGDCVVVKRCERQKKNGHYYRRRKWRPNNPNAWYDMTDIASLALYTV